MSGARRVYRNISTYLPGGERVFAAKQLLLSRDLPLAYWQVPKAGCSTIKRSIIDLTRRSTEDVSQRQLHQNREWFKFDDAEFFDVLRARSRGAGLVTFAVSRNPFTRILSAYLEKIHNARDGLRYRVELGLPERGPVSFPEFLTAVRRKPILSLDPHFAPQSNLVPIREVRFDVVGSVEDLGGALHSLGRRLGLDELNVTFQAPHSERAGDKRNVEIYWDSKSVQSVIEIYGDDFKMFGYSTSIEMASAPPVNEVFCPDDGVEISEYFSGALALHCHHKLYRVLSAFWTRPSEVDD